MMAAGDRSSLSRSIRDVLLAVGNEVAETHYCVYVFQQRKCISFNKQSSDSLDFAEGFVFLILLMLK